MKQWIPKFIKKDLNYKSQDVVTAADYNAVFNLLITQGDYNSEWLAWLTQEGFAEFFKDLNGDDIKQLVVQAAGEQLEELAAASTNKTSAYLNQPVFTFIDESATTSAKDIFKTVLDEYGIVGTVSCYCNLVDTGTPHMTLTDLQAFQADGYAVINHGSTKADVDDDNVYDVVNSSYTYMDRNNLTTGLQIFAYNNIEAPSEDVQDIVNSRFNAAIGNEIGVNDTDTYDKGWVLVVPLDADEDVIRAAIAETVQNNRWCVFKCDTSVPEFDAAVIHNAAQAVLLEKDVLVTTVPNASSLADNTINNRLKTMQSEITWLQTQVGIIKSQLNNARRITHGSTTSGLPAGGNTGDIHIMFEK